MRTTTTTRTQMLTTRYARLRRQLKITKQHHLKKDILGILVKYQLCDFCMSRFIPLLRVYLIQGPR